MIGEDEVELNLLVPSTNHEIRSGRLGVDDEEAHLVNGGIEGHVSEAVDPIGVLHEDRGPRDDGVLGVRLDREVGPRRRPTSTEPSAAPFKSTMRPLGPVEGSSGLTHR